MKHKDTSVLQLLVIVFHFINFKKTKTDAGGGRGGGGGGGGCTHQKKKTK